MRPTSFMFFGDFPLSSPFFERDDGLFRKSRKAVILTACAPLFIDTFSSGLLVPILPHALEHYYLIDPEYSGLIFSAYSLGAIVMMPVFGYLNDKYPQYQKKFMIAGYIGMVIASLMMLYSHALYVLVISRLISGLCSAIFWNCSMCLITRVARKDLGFLMGIALTCHSVGFAIGPIVGGLLYDYLSIGYVFYSTVVLSFIGIGLRMYICEKRAIKRTQNSSEVRTSLSVVPFIKIVKSPKVLYGSFISLAFGIILSSFEPVLPFFLIEQYKLSASVVGAIYIAIILPNIFFSAKFGKMSDSYGSKRFIVIGLLIGIASCACLGLVDNIFVLVVMLFLIGLSDSLSLTPLYQLIGTAHISTHNKSYALLNGSYAVGTLLGPLCGNEIYFQFGFKVLLSCLATILAVCLLVTTAMNLKAPKKRRSSNISSTLLNESTDSIDSYGYI